MFTTIEELQNNSSITYGATVKFGNKVFHTNLNWKGEFSAEIYEFTAKPDEGDFGSIETPITLVKKANEVFEDNGHALAWCYEHANK